MAVFQRMDVNTLKLRQLIFKNPDETPIPANYHLLSKGDGNTVWAPSIDVQQFRNLSETIDILTKPESIYEKIHKPAISTAIANFNADTITSQIADKFLGPESILFNENTLSDRVLKPLLPEINKLFNMQNESATTYLDNKMAEIKDSITAYNSQSSEHELKIAQTVEASLLQLETSVQNFLQTEGVKAQIQDAISSELISENTRTTIETIIQSYVHTPEALFEEKFAHFLQSENGRTYLDNAIESYFKSPNNLAQYLQLQDETKNLSQTSLTEIISSDSLINILKSDFVTETLITTIETILSSDSLMNAMAAYTDTALSNFSTNQGYALMTILAQPFPSDIYTNLSTLNTFSTNQSSTNAYFVELTSSLYETFDELRTYSEVIVISTISSLNKDYSTIISRYSNSYLASTGIFMNTIQSSIIGLQAPSFATINNNISTLVLKQFADPSQITVNSNYNISTITNGSTITGLSSFSASAINLDLRLADNFYINLSDIGQNVFYGLTYTTNSTIRNRNITVEIDLKSSRANNFTILDTDNLSAWLSKPQIYNPIQNKLISSPAPTSADILISSFIGKYIVEMRYTNNALHVKNILTYPYIYSNLTLTNPSTSALTLSSNASVTPPLINQNAIYAGTNFTLGWSTNDPNIPVGVRFTGYDAIVPTKRIFAWSGPYNSGLLSSSTIAIPSNLPLAIYDSMQIMIYPYSGLYSNSLDGNLQLSGKILDSKPITPNICVIKPILNTTFRIFNNGLNKYLTIGDISVFSSEGVNLVRPGAGTIVDISASSVFQNDPAWKPENVLDGNPNTQFRSGFNLASGPDINAWLELRVTPSTNISANTFISSINITGSLSATSLEGMQMQIKNNFSTFITSSVSKTLTGEFIQSFSF